MRLTLAEDSQRMTSRNVCTGRGQAVLSRLRSTDDFTHKDKISVADRKLILFLIVALTDASGRLRSAYEAILVRYGTTKGSWAFGRDIGGLQRSGSKFLGKGAVRLPSWDKVHDALTATTPPAQLPRMLAHAAGLYCAAAGVDHPGGEYRGEIVHPAWAEAEVVTVGGIECFLADQEVPADLESTELDEAGLRAHIKDLRVLLATTSRGFQEVQRDNDKLRHELAMHRNALVETLDLRGRNRDLIRQISFANEGWLRSLRAEHRGVSDETLRALISEQTARMSKRRSSPPIEWINTASGE